MKIPDQTAKTSEDMLFVLIVDDSEDNRLIIERFLLGEFRTFSADSGQAALKLLDSYTPSLILLDIMMPEMDGYEVCKRLKENPKTADIPVVFLTALDSEQDKARAFSVGASGFLVKPVKKTVLIGTIETHLKVKSQWALLDAETRSLRDRLREADFSRFVGFLTFLGNKGALTMKGLSMDDERIAMARDIPSSDLYSLCDLYGLNDRSMSKLIADYLQLPWHPILDSSKIALGKLPIQFSRKHHVVAMEDLSGSTVYMVSNPFDLDTMDALISIRRYDGSFSLAITAPDNIISLFAGIDLAEEEPKAKTELIDSEDFDINSLLLMDTEPFNHSTTATKGDPKKGREIDAKITESADDPYHLIIHPSAIDKHDQDIDQTSLKPGKKRILIVEDDEVSRVLIKRFLQDEYDVSLSSDGIEGLLLLGKDKIDLIISDINMPNLDGFAFAEMIRQKGIDVPMIFLTARDDSKDEVRGLELGALDYIRKPIKREILLMRVKRILR